MAKKQIKELIVKTSSPNSKETRKELQSITRAMEEAGVSAKGMNKQIGGNVKATRALAKEFANISSSLSTAAKAAKSFNNALNGNTKTSTKKISAYMENIELLTLSMRDLATEAQKAYPAINKLGSAVQPSEMRAVAETIDLIHDELVTLNSTTRESVATLDRLSDKIVDVEVQTKKGRLQTELLNESMHEGARANKKYGTSAGKAANDARRLAGAGSQGARAFSDMAFRMNPLVSLYASIAVNVYALTEAFRLLTEASNLNRLREQTARFAATLSGIDIEGLSTDLQALSGNAINAGDALRQSVRGVSYGFAADDLERLTVGARKASVALGVNFADAMDRAFRGIAKQEVEVLDEIGVVTRLETAYKKYAGQLNKTVDDLTEVERRTALTVEVISQLEKRFSSFDTAATGMEQVGVAVKDLVDNVLILSSTKLDGFAKEIASVVRGFQGVKSWTDRVTQAQEVYNQAIASGNTSQAAVAYDELQQALQKVRLEQIEGTKENENYKRSVMEAQSAQSVLNKAIGAAYVGIVVYTTILAGTFIKATVAATVGTYKFIAAIKSSRAVALASAAAMGVYSTALSIYTSIVVLGTKATLAFIASAALVVSPILLAAGAIAALAALIDYFSGGWVMEIFSWITEKIGDFFSWIGEKISSFLDWLGVTALETGKDLADGVGSGLDTIAEHQGIDKITSQFLGLNKSAKVTAEAVTRYMKDIDKSTPSFSSELAGEDRPGFSIMTRAEAEKNLEYINTSKAAVQQLQTDLTSLSPPTTSFEKFATTLKTLANIPLTLALDDDEFDIAKRRFDELKEQGVIPLDVEFHEFSKFSDEVSSAAKALRTIGDDASFAVNKLSATLNANDPAANFKTVGEELKFVNKELSLWKTTGKEVGKEEKLQLERKRELLELEQSRAKYALEYAELNRAIDFSERAGLETLRQQTSMQSEILAFEIQIAQARITAAKAKGQDVTQLEYELQLLKQRQIYTKQEEARGVAEASRNLAIKSLEREKELAGTAAERARIEARILQLKQQQINAMPQGTERNVAQAEQDTSTDQNKAKALSATARDMSSISASMASMPGLTDLQSTALSATSALTDVYADFQETMKDSGKSFFEFLKGDIESFSQVASAGLQFAQGVFQQASQAKVESINREIEAEKRRDGKSKESKEKIKRLEAKRIKEEAKAKKASIIMSTATAVMQGFAQGGPIVGAMLAVPTIAMGMMQLSQIDKATSGQLAGLNESGGGLKLEGGKRGNEVDVSSKANAGELSYLRGESGTGSVGNFTPGRASGNYASAGTSITVGESGPEEITPATPVNVTPSGSSNDKPSIVFSPVINAQAVDSAGMEELLTRYSRELYDGLERELNARNQTLESV